MAAQTQASRVIRLARRRGMVRARDLRAIDADPRIIRWLAERGDLVSRSRGVYVLPDHEPSRHTELAEVCLRVPSATVCLLSALDFHELTTQMAHQTWIMIARSGWRPRIEKPPVRIVYASGPSLTEGVERHTIEGVDVRITSPAKTVADCFKYRRRVGQDVALEALRDCLRERKATPDQILAMAKVNRVARTLGPYLEALA